MSSSSSSTHAPEQTSTGQEKDLNINSKKTLEDNQEIINEIFEKVNINTNSNTETKANKEEDQQEDNQDDSLSCSEDEEHDDGNGDPDEVQQKEGVLIDEETLRQAEEKLTETEKQERMELAAIKKEEGNVAFKQEAWESAVECYSEAMQASLFSQHELRSIILSNQAAALIKLGRKDHALENLDKSLKINPSYMRARLRRAVLNEEMDRLEEALEDYKAALEADPSLTVARAACVRLPDKIRVKTEKMKEEMFSKLKELGNVVLKPFGLSTDNFKVQQDPTTGSYSINMQK